MIGWKGILVSSSIVIAVHSAAYAQPQRQAVQPPPPAPSRANDHRVELDATGVGDWTFLNPRRPAPIYVTEQDLDFANTTASRTFTIKLEALPVPDALAGTLLLSDPSGAQNAAERQFGVRLTDCSRPGVAEQTTCVPTLTIPPLSSKTVSRELLKNYPATQSISFTVAFFDEAELPARPKGYFWIQTGAPTDLQDKPSTFKLTAVGSVDAVRDPYFGADDSVSIDAERVYDGKRVKQFKGLARIGAAYELGTRATAAIELNVKNAAFGRIGEDLTVKAHQYRFEVFGFTGSSLRFGKFTFAKPTDGLAINETGEGVMARFRWFALSHLVRREGAAGTLDPEDNDQRTWILEATSLPVGRLGSLRAVNVIALRGEDETVGRERRYYTGGGEVLFGVPQLPRLGGSVAYYRSASRPRDNSAATKADGWAWLGRLSHTWMQTSSQKALRNASIVVARGSSDNPATPEFEGYIGETAGYDPDGAIYMKALPRLRLEPVPTYKNADDKDVFEFSRATLMNRTLISVGFTDQTFSPLAWLAEGLSIPQKDIKTQHTTLKFLHYGFAEQVAGTRTGSSEIRFETLLESPQGVKYTLRLSRMLARGPLEALFPKEPFSLLLGCSVTLN